MDTLLDKLKNCNATIAVIGLGYVGLPLLLRLSKAGYNVIGLDINESHVQQLTNAVSPFVHIQNKEIEQLVNKGAQLTTDMKNVARADALILCVPTPLTRHREPDLSYIINSIESIQNDIHEDMMIVLESTTWPGTTEEVLKPLIEENGLTIGENFYLAYSPEREDPGNKDFKLEQIPKVISGITQKCLERADALYSNLVEKTVPVSSTRAAELTKLLENIQRSVNIGLMNEMKIIANKLNIDIFEVIDAAKTKPFGFSAYYPGPGLGGHCIPIDPFYLTWKAREKGVNTRFIELSGEINTDMPQYVIDGLIKELSVTLKKAINGANILLVGLAYKKNVNDIRESPTFGLMSLLKNYNAEFDYYDPFVPKIPVTREHKHFSGKESVDIQKISEKHYDAAIIVTDHDCLDYSHIAQISSLIIDTRGKAKSQISSIPVSIY